VQEPSPHSSSHAAPPRECSTCAAAEPEHMQALQTRVPSVCRRAVVRIRGAADRLNSRIHRPTRSTRRHFQPAHQRAISLSRQRTPAVSSPCEDTPIPICRCPAGPYGVQARAADAIIALKPRAVVVDVMFVDPRRRHASRTRRRDRALQARGVPLYLTGERTRRPDRLPCAGRLAATGVRILDPTILSFKESCAISAPGSASARRFRINRASRGVQVYKDLFRKRR